MGKEGRNRRLCFRGEIHKQNKLLKIYVVEGGSIVEGKRKDNLNEEKWYCFVFNRRQRKCIVT